MNPCSQAQMTGHFQRAAQCPAARTNSAREGLVFPLHPTHQYSFTCLHSGFNAVDRIDRSIAQIYKCRWQVNYFFKWIKQHLRIKRSTAPARMP